MNTTPCIKLCKINYKGYCIGCQRTLNEISNWSRLSEKERLDIMKKLESRKDNKK